MARKAKRNDLQTSNKSNSSLPPDHGRQPRIVGWLVLIVGGISTWYWYKPLPDVVHQTVHSTNPSPWPSSDSGPKSLWSDQGLVVPSTSGVFENPIEFGNANSPSPNDSNLIGTPKVTLVPWSETQHDIREVLKTERIQSSPSTPDLNAGSLIAKIPQTLLPERNQSRDDNVSMVGKSSWPDEGYIPPQKAKRRNQAQITAPIPPFLETGMKSIRTTESDDLSHPLEAAKPNTESPVVPEPIRQPQFIRQPKRNT